ncbi:Protein CBR-NDG-4 [Caenorhabditis briggsae]|uniref:Protein CBR-NDG-4 n=1 Tax=Caenorhabditis briggsae TaxID=6238 RepID=A8XSY0_CAEBR|nr:Protein CBR-NDG-4 [Caenorhabditis briggsae]CAP35583.2 Protein CBR-NDG-4 [Caenorhabditis briggsae]
MRSFLLILALCHLALSCTLCPFRIPPRPRPLDQYKLPKVGGKQFDLEKMPKFCNASKQLPVGAECRAQFEHIFCSADRLTDTFSGCQSIVNKSLSEQEQCSKCAYQKADNSWVMRWFDSLGKPAAGITEGNYYWLGDYELCTVLRDEKSFDGQYCRIEMEVPDAGVESGCPQTDPLSIILGVCFPAACSVQDLAKVSGLYLPYNLKVECESQGRWSAITILLLVLFAVWLVPQAVSTIQPHLNDSVLHCFSISENAKRTFSTRRDSPHLHVVHGLEFLLFFTIVCGMVYTSCFHILVKRKKDSQNKIRNFQKTLHFLSKAFHHYQCILSITIRTKSMDFLLYPHFIQLTCFSGLFQLFWPAYIFCVIFMYTVFPGVSSGPMWIHTDTVNRCEGGWWKNLLFINNWFNVTDTCVDLGYVISLEAQYFLILILFIYLSSKFVMITQVSFSPQIQSRYFVNVQIVVYLIFGSSIVFSFVRAYRQDLPPAPMLTLEPEPLEKIYAVYDQLMLSLFARSSSYCLGFIFGIGCATASEDLRKMGLRYRWHAILAVACIASGIFPFVGAFPYSAWNWSSNFRFMNALYAAFHRPMWSFSLLSFVYLCHHGAFKWINALLEWRAFTPLSKVTWVALVVAEPIILYFFSSLNKPAYATHWSTLYTAISAALLSYMIAIFLDIFVTRPIRYLIYPEQMHRYAQAHTQEQQRAAAV